MNNLGLTYNSQGRYDEARKLYENALADLEEHRDERDRDVLTTMTNLGSCYDGLGLFDQAEGLWNKTLATTIRLHSMYMCCSKRCTMFEVSSTTQQISLNEFVIPQPRPWGRATQSSCRLRITWYRIWKLC